MSALPRKPAFDAVRDLPGVPANIWDDAGNILALNNLLDAFGAAREEKPSPATRHTLADPGAFFAHVRKITGGLDQVQVDTINMLLDKATHWPVGWLAYGLATAWHECRLKPIEEWGKGQGRPYSKPGKYGQSQHGRGLVQLTWDRNYEWADKALGLGGKLLADFNLALQPDIAAAILVKGMETGAFTGKALAGSIEARGTVAAFTDARRIINGTDKSQLIAGYAEQFQIALEKGSWR